MATERATVERQKAAPATEWCREYVFAIPDDSFLGDLIAVMKVAGYSDNDILSVRLALEEAVVNAYTHGNQRDATKRIKVSYQVTSRSVRADVEDEGQGFRPRLVADPTLPENLDKERGRGMSLMRTFMMQVRFNRRGNKVMMSKNKSGA
jgi:anti-sigma regulatory factor (Ser/Thr protein kinase)